MQLKSARMGAIAACGGCRSKFTVDQKTLAPVAPPHAARPEVPTQSHSQGQTRPDRPTHPTAHRHHHAGPGRGATAPTIPVAHPASDSADLAAAAVASERLRHQKLHRKKGVKWGMVVAMSVVMLMLGGLLFLLIAFQGNSPFKREVYVDAKGNPITGEIVITRKADGTLVTSAAPPSTDGSAPASTGATAAPPAAAPPARSTAPMLSLEPMQAVEGQWKAIDPPSRPLEMTIAREALLWTPQLRRDSEQHRATVSIQYLTELEAIYEDAFLNVQLVDADRKAFAELTHVVPVVISRQGMTMSVPVPAHLLERAADVVADITPRTEVEDAVPLEMLDSQPLAGGGSAAVELIVLNPHDDEVKNPMLVVQVFNGEGWVIGLWRGELKATIPAQGKFVFQVDPKLPPKSEPARIVVRGFAHRAG
jgi:hypothetical protein